MWSKRLGGTVRGFSLTARGFSLLELIVVICLIGILAAISFPNLQAALLTARVTATMADLRVFEHAIQRLGMDCYSPQWTRAGDPGMVERPNWFQDCWQGPYLSTWRSSTPLGGELRYWGKNGKQPRIRIRRMEGTGAGLLLRKLIERYGEGAIAKLRKRKRGWDIDIIVPATPLAEKRSRKKG